MARYVDEVTTVLSADRPAQDSAGGFVAGDTLVSDRREDGYYAVVTGVGPEGLWYESEDFGPYPTRAEAEAAARASAVEDA